MEVLLKVNNFPVTRKSNINGAAGSWRDNKKAPLTDWINDENPTQQ
jgi:hypothetical protein